MNKKELLSNTIASLKSIRKDIRTKHIKDVIIFWSVALFGLSIGLVAAFNVVDFLDELDMHMLASFLTPCIAGATLFAFSKFDFMREIENKMPQRKIDLCKYDFCIKTIENIHNEKIVSKNDFLYTSGYLNAKHNFDLEKIVSVKEATGESKTIAEFVIVPREIMKKIEKIKKD